MFQLWVEYILFQMLCMADMPFVPYAVLAYKGEHRMLSFLDPKP